MPSTNTDPRASSSRRYSTRNGTAGPPTHQGQILIDVIILSLPIREVRRLQIVIWQKVAVCGMFLLGGL